MIEKLESVRVKIGVLDKRIWKFDNAGVHSSSKAYELMASNVMKFYFMLNCVRLSGNIMCLEGYGGNVWTGGASLNCDRSKESSIH
ncbi:hypothetical protein SLEP1_g27462 [Rubroshorea leprosula]|uniref:Uncharacterized protein n=1 Tax=Rubroshorea leprosula TaxID=152421 RepID=A0AAV5JZ72_9ROSI|nr:hypothetical protein SLEP1_g27462 [Rubroshorea leprosula]